MREVRMALAGGRRQLRWWSRISSKKSPSAAWASRCWTACTPAQQVIKIVNEEMTALMGGEHAKLTWSSSRAHHLYAVRPAGRR